VWHLLRSAQLQEGFDVLRERGFGRYDMTVLKYDEPEFSFLTDPNAPWMSIVKKCLGEKATLIHKGCFMSLPGAHHQVYHQVSERTSGKGYNHPHPLLN